MNYKEGTVRVNLQKLHSIIIVLIRNISGHLTDQHLKITIQTPRKDKQLEGCAVKGRSKKHSPTCKHIIVPTH